MTDSTRLKRHSQGRTRKTLGWMAFAVAYVTVFLMISLAPSDDGDSATGPTQLAGGFSAQQN